jgi:hypothetical protein
LTVQAQSDDELNSRFAAAMARIRAWATDAAPHHRAAFVHTYRLLDEAATRKRLLVLRTQFSDSWESSNAEEAQRTQNGAR